MLSALKRNLKQYLNDGSVCAVFDRDKAHLMWGLKGQPPRCRTALLAKIREEALGPPFEVIFLEENLESLVAASCQVLDREPFQHKPTPLERDVILKKAAFHPSSEIRTRIRSAVPSFDRLVRKVGELATPLVYGARQIR